MGTIVSKIKRKVDSINACLCLKIALQTLGKKPRSLENWETKQKLLFPSSLFQVLDFQHSCKALLFEVRTTQA